MAHKKTLEEKMRVRAVPIKDEALEAIHAKFVKGPSKLYGSAMAEDESVGVGDVTAQVAGEPSWMASSEYTMGPPPVATPTNKTMDRASE